MNLVSETSYQSEKVIHITEKSLIPFHYSQIPLILASRGHNKRLKEKYDFDLFEDIIDFSFDDEIDNRKRLQKYFDEVKKIQKNEQKIKEFFKHNKNRFDLNRKKIKDILNDKTDYNFFKNLI